MKKETTISAVFEETISRMKGDGVILLAGDPPNPMTIGWGTIGYIWGRKIFTILVRPSRFTHALMEKSKEFTVNILGDEFRRQLSLCGTKSGRNTDKIKECGFTLENGICVKTPFIRESHIHYECRIVQENELLPEKIAADIAKTYYPAGDFHTVYYGEILGIFKCSPTL
jgi:flavin reductase (DIM6/NTAB) family NADH-FMN oxidoreductase RutF